MDTDHWTLHYNLVNESTIWLDWKPKLDLREYIFSRHGVDLMNWE